MIEKIYSLVDPSLLLHQIVRKPAHEGRINLCEDSAFLQCALLMHSAGKTFKPHIHKVHERHDKNYLAQESWVVIEGLVLVHFYDIDGEELASYELFPGDASFTFYGGHTYDILDDNTIVYEYKSGPYIDQQHDKKFI